MSYLFRRNGIFYFRFAIPTQLRQAYGGKTEIRKSLKTFNKTTAQSLALYIAVHIKADMTVKRKRIAGKVILPNENIPVKTPELDENIRRCIEIKLGEGEPVIIINHDDPEEELRAAKEILGNLRSNNKTISSPKPAPTSSSKSCQPIEIRFRCTETNLYSNSLP